MNLQQLIFRRLYRRTPSVDALPWHREEPPALLERALDSRDRPDRALDLGCGEGVYAVHMAARGWDVTAIDFVPAALGATRARAAAAGVTLDLHECDVIDFSTDQPFDLVLDSGCLHHLPKEEIGPYRARLDRWLAPGGDYVLVHFAHRPRIGWIPRGPRHLTRDQALERFAPYELVAEDETSFDVPFPMGTMRAGVYWFRRPG